MVINRLKNGERNTDIAKELGVGHSTISSMWKDREKIERSCRGEKSSMKKLRSGMHNDLEMALLRWCQDRSDRNTPVSGPALQRIANELAAGLGKPDFNCSISWIQRFRTRNSFLFAPVAGDAGPMYGPVVRNWLDAVWPKLRDGYADDKIYNADEVAVFFNMLPDSRSEEDADVLDGSQNIANRRLTVLVAASMTGRKCRPIVIGKRRAPQCFTEPGATAPPVAYVTDYRACMTSDLWAQVLLKWDAELGQNGENILLVVDHSPAHTAVALRHIKVVVLPSYFTSNLQPTSLGITKCLKTVFRKCLMQTVVGNMRNEIKTGVSVLDGLLMIVRAWENIPTTGIQNCFRRAGFHAKIKQEVQGEGVGKDGDKQTGMFNIEDYVNMSINMSS